MEQLSDNAIVLLAIVESYGYLTPDEVKNHAQMFSKASDNIVYDGPRPNFMNNQIFDSAWNELLSSGMLIQVGSNDNEPKFNTKSSVNAIDEICDSHNEKLSFDAII